MMYPTLSSAVKKVDAIYSSTSHSDIWVNKSGAYPGKEEVPIKWFGKGCDVEFENMKVSAPTEYDKYLTHIYGDYIAGRSLNEINALALQGGEGGSQQGGNSDYSDRY